MSRRRVPREPPRARVARAASELAALLRAGAGASAAWAPQRVTDPAEPTGGDVGRVSDVDQALDAAATAAAEGGDPAAALWAASVPAPARGAVDALAATWRTVTVTGAPAAAVLERLATSLADEAAAQDAHDAALAGPRATARLLLALPAAGPVLGAAVGADPLGVLVGTPAGRWCLVAGSGCALAGWVWSSLLVRAAEARSR